MMKKGEKTSLFINIISSSPGLPIKNNNNIPKVINKIK